MSIRVAAIVVLGCALLAGCSRAKAGDPCEQGKGACQDRANQLVCTEGRLISSPCRGPKGCSTDADQVRCDFSGNAEGEPCAAASEGQTQCAADHRRMVVCRAGKYLLLSCRGPKGCEDAGAQASCDRSLQMEGDPCVQDDSHACSMDRKRSLVCKGGKLVMDEHCRGPKACEAQGAVVTCDRGRQNAGDPCHKADDHECGTDGKSLLVCKGNRWELGERCAGGCKAGADQVRCE